MAKICDELRDSILQAAMQGKLTEQLPSDGNAEDLYQQIQVKKAELIKEGKIKKSKPLPSIKPDEIPFEIPKNWKWVRLEEIYSITAGGTPSRGHSDYWNGNVPWVKIGDMTGKYVDETSEKISELGLRSSSAKLMKPGTLLCSIFASIGTVSILRIEAATNQAIACLSQYGHMVDEDYSYYMLLNLKSTLLDEGRGMAQSNINQKILAHAAIPLPPLAEQKRIVEKLDELFARVADLERSADALASLNKSFPGDIKDSILQAAMQGKLTEQLPSDGNAEDLYQQIQVKKAELIKEGKIKKSKPLPPIKPDEIPFEIPKNWKWVRLEEIVGKEIKRGKSPRYGKNKYAYAFAQKCNTKTNGIDLSRAKSISSESTGRYQKSDALREGDIVVNSTGTGTLGRVGIIDVTIPDGVAYYADSHVAVVRPLCNAQFIYYMVKSRENLLVSMGGGSTNQKELKPSDVASILIPLPPLAEQKRIVEKLNNLLSKADDIAGMIGE